MGGGTGNNRPMSPQEREKAERAAEAELDRAREVKRTIFISFAAEDIDNVNLLRGQARNENSEIAFVDRSVRDPYDSERADYIKQRISERIRQCSLTVVYLSEDASRSQWVNWEVERSLELGKDVVAVHSGDEPPSVLPSAVSTHGIRIIPWSQLAGSLRG